MYNIWILLGEVSEAKVQRPRRSLFPLRLIARHSFEE